MTVTVKCYECNGQGGWGHVSIEHDIIGRTSTRETKERFYRCPTCHGSGQVTQAVRSQSQLAEQERMDAFDEEMGRMAEQFYQQLDRERAIDYLNRYR